MLRGQRRKGTPQCSAMHTVTLLLADSLHTAPPAMLWPGLFTHYGNPGPVKIGCCEMSGSGNHRARLHGQPSHVAVQNNASRYGIREPAGKGRNAEHFCWEPLGNNGELSSSPTAHQPPGYHPGVSWNPPLGETFRASETTWGFKLCRVSHK